MEFLLNLNVKPPLHKPQDPPHKRKAFLATVLVLNLRYYGELKTDYFLFVCRRLVVHVTSTIE